MNDDQKKQDILHQLDFLIAQYTDIARHSKAHDKKQRIEISSAVYDEKEPQAAIRTILSNWISQGRRVKEFEAAFAAYIGVKHAIAVNSGSSANLVAISAALESGLLEKGDEIIVPASTFPPVASPIIQLGCVPVYVDVNQHTYNIDPDALEAAISTKTKWLMPVHTLGFPAEMERIMEIARHHKLYVLEDCCEAHGSSIDGKRVGSFGAMGTFSFFVAHNMTTGEGGMVVTNDDNLMRVCRSLREFGRVDQTNVQQDRFYTDEILKDYDKRYLFERLGFNVRMTDVTASFGCVQLSKLDSLNVQRIQNAAYFSKRLKKYNKYLHVVDVPSNIVHTYYTYPFLIDPDSGLKRIELVKFLEENGIETRAMFAGCLPDQPAFRTAPMRIAGDLKNARIVRDFAFFIGVHPRLSSDDLERVCDVFDSFFQRLV